jgi:hypothetical protein
MPGGGPRFYALFSTFLPALYLWDRRILGHRLALSWLLALLFARQRNQAYETNRYVLENTRRGSAWWGRGPMLVRVLFRARGPVIYLFLFYSGPSPVVGSANTKVLGENVSIMRFRRVILALCRNSAYPGADVPGSPFGPGTTGPRDTRGLRPGRLNVQRSANVTVLVLLR